MATAGAPEKLTSTLPILTAALVLLLCLSSLAHSQAANPSSLSSARSLFASQRKSPQIPNCSELSSITECSQKPQCRWCRSEALDDTCFGATEARRLPYQVFSCN